MDILNQTDSFILTINGQKKICSDKIFLDKDGEIYPGQWFRDQLIVVAKLLGLNYIDPITKNPYSNLYLGSIIQTSGLHIEEGVLNSEKLSAFGLKGETIEVSLNSFRNNIIMDNYDNFNIMIKDQKLSKSKSQPCNHGALVYKNNSCYMDVILMLLLINSPENCFSSFLGTKIKTSKSESLKELYKIYININNNNDTNLDNFRSTLSDDPYKDGSQGDASEFLYYLLDNIIGKLVRYKPYNKYLSYKLMKPFDGEAKDKVIGHSSNESDIVNPYTLESEGNIELETIKNKSRFIISQPIDYRPFTKGIKKLNINDLLCLQEFNLIAGHEKYNAQIETTIIDSANYLIIQIARKIKGKIDTFHIEPNEKFNLGGKNMKLIGIIAFSGEDNLGHYHGYYLCNGDWYKYDDIATTKLFKLTHSFSHLLTEERSICKLGTIFLYC